MASANINVEQVTSQEDTIPVSETQLGWYCYPDGTEYTGEWSNKGTKEGMGHLKLPNGAVYVGRFENGLPFGVGLMRFPDGSKYEGEFMHGWFHGHGAFSRSDGMKFEGEFRGGKIWGSGIVTYADGTHGFPRQEGYFQDCRFVRKLRCKETILKAQKIALMARTQCQ